MNKITVFFQPLGNTDCLGVVFERKKMKKYVFIFLIVASVQQMSAQYKAVLRTDRPTPQSIYGTTVVDQEGHDVQLGEYAGKVLLIVNTATRCGFTPQYEELQQLYEEFKDREFEILDFPCNQFGEQAPGSNEEIRNFCTSNYSITFKQFDKIDVNGINESPLYANLKMQAAFEGLDTTDRIGAYLHKRLKKEDPDYAKNPEIKWNFTKFLVGRDGLVVRRFEPTTTMDKVRRAVEEELEK